jgi:hypothetical protein
MGDLMKSPTDKIVILDLHTGLGPAGYGELIYSGTDLAEYLRAVKWFGPEVTSTVKGDSASAPVSGTLADGVQRICAGVQCTFLAIEYGTIPVMEVFAALRAENWLIAKAGAGEPLRQQIKKQLRDAFYIDESWWKAAVYGRSLDMFLRAGRALT